MKQFVLCSVFVVLLGAGSLQAGVVFSTLGPGDSYNTSSGYTIGSAGAEYDQGNQFAINVATPHQLDSIEVAISLVSGTNSVDIWLMTDNAGEPGAIIEAFNFTNMGPFGSSNPLLVGNSVLNPVLDPGTDYWLITTAPVGHTWAAWNLSDPSIIGPRAVREGAGSWSVSDSDMAAFRINGSPVIPAPGAILLGGLGAGCVGWLRRRKTV